ncbi:hypothetical protein C5142_02335 [Rhodococcus sp. BGS-1C]|jgi:hypothetical protein|uniref:hypothetical protein n=1 Tax=Nocardiaceae TaxID=85025 RepID=UPI0019D22054|nr:MULTISPECIES: hypothetical protein [Rhodococcus]MCC8930211.1 hypothetical protein [Rhodococcus sp. I2R]MCZ4275327.1 hypothetical protein [Rhodococcus yunnanensis]
MKKLLNSLSEDEYVLIRETKKSEMSGLSEDDLIDLHARIRRGRNKYVKLYRRAGAAKVGAKGARGAGKAANSRNAAKAEAFEVALSRVSRRLAAVSKDTARELKAERLSRARKSSPSPGEGGAGEGKVVSAGKSRVDATRKSPGRKKYEASTIAAGKRRQAKKDRT